MRKVLDVTALAIRIRWPANRQPAVSSCFVLRPPADRAGVLQHRRCSRAFGCAVLYCTMSCVHTSLQHVGPPQGYGARWAVEGVTEPGAAAPVDGRGFEGGVGSREAHGGESEGTGVAARLPAGEGGSGQPRFRFRGFLEPTMEGGHEVGWRH